MEKWLLKLGCHGNINVDIHVTTALKCSQINFRNVAKFGGPSLNGGLKSPPRVWIGLKFWHDDSESLRTEFQIFSRFYSFGIPRSDLSTKKTKPYIEIWSESLEVMLQFSHIEPGLLLKNVSITIKSIGESLLTSLFTFLLICARINP